MEDLPKESEAFDKLTYKHPVYTQIEDQQQLRKYFKEQVLGYFLPFRDDTHDHLMRHSTLRRSVQSLYSANDSMSSHSGPIRGWNSYLELEENISTFDSPGILFDLPSYTDVKQIKGSPVNLVLTCIFKGDSIWVVTWKKDTLEKYNTIFLNLKHPGHKLMTKKIKKNSGVKHSILMFTSGNCIVFAAKGEQIIYQFDTVSHKFEKLTNIIDSTDVCFYSIAAICGNDTDTYIIDEMCHDRIMVMDSNFQINHAIDAGLAQSHRGEIDMCLTSWYGLTQHISARHTLLQFVLSMRIGLFGNYIVISVLNISVPAASHLQ